MIVHLSKISAGTIQASANIARWLSEKTGLPLVDRDELLEKSDTVVVVNSPSAFCEWLDAFVEFALSAKRLVWVMNDYSLYPPTQLRDALGMRKMEMWTSVPELSERLAGRWTFRNLPRCGKYVNWNQLTYTPTQPGPTDNTVPGLVYWGAFREYRVKQFEKYLVGPYPVHISSGDRALQNFEGLAPDARLYRLAKGCLADWVREFQATIYIEDTYSNSMYCSPANRWYEALSARLPCFVDEDAMGTLKRAGFSVPDVFVVRSSEDVASRINEVRFSDIPVEINLDAQFEEAWKS